MNAFTVSFLDGVAVGIAGGKLGVMLGCAGDTRQVPYASESDSARSVWSRMSFE